MRATTTAVSIVWSGRRCLPVPSPEAAHALAARLERPLLVGEWGGDLPDGFDLQNSPTGAAAPGSPDGTAILLCTSRNRMVPAAKTAPGPYAGRLPNLTA